MASLIAAATGAATSADIVITGSTTYSLVTPSGQMPNLGYAEIQLKNSSGGYTTFATLDQTHPVHVTSTAGTIRVVKYDAGVAFGVDYTVGSSAGGASASTALPAGTDRSGTITTGGTAQTLAPAKTDRVSLTGQNISTADLWINEIGGTAAVNSPGSYKIAAGQAFAIGTNRAISIVGATTGQQFTATES